MCHGNSLLTCHYTSSSSRAPAPPNALSFSLPPLPEQRPGAARVQGPGVRCARPRCRCLPGPGSPVAHWRVHEHSSIRKRFTEIILQVEIKVVTSFSRVNQQYHVR